MLLKISLMGSTAELRRAAIGIVHQMWLMVRWYVCGRVWIEPPLSDPAIQIAP